MEVEVAQVCLPNLPNDNIIDILTRLPVKTLVKFKCVCKSWLSLISSSQFIKTHLKMSTTTNNSYLNHTIILGSADVHITCSLYSLLYDTPSVNPLLIDIPMKTPHFVLWIIGCCNGLLCVSVDPDTLIIYNPGLRKFKKLPFSGSDVEFNSYITYGFGYDEVTDDYKVMELRCFYEDEYHYEGNYEGKVYSLRNNSWKTINVPDRPVSGSGTFVNGKLHWLANRRGDYWEILSLDLVTEKYNMISEPDYDIYEDVSIEWGVMEFGGCLCVCGEYNKICLDVWMMKEYGVEDSWCKLLSIPIPIDPRGHLWPVFVTDKGEVLLNYYPSMMLYKSSDGMFENREILEPDGDPLLVSSPCYIESLVIPW